MNYCLDLNRRPMKETVAKFAGSKKFLLAIIFSLFASFTAAITSCFEYYSLFDLQYLLDYSREPIYKFYLSDIFIYISIGLALLVLILSILSSACLLNLRAYFTGKASRPSGAKGFLTIYIINLVVSLVQIPLSMYYGIMTVESTLSGKQLYGVFTIFFIIVMIPVIAGTIVLTIFQYKGIKKSFNFAIAAYDERNSGKLSIFVLVMAIITLAMLGISLFSTFVSVYTVIKASALTVSSLIFNGIFPMLSVVFLFVSTLLYVIIMVKFKSEMQIAAQESFAIQAQLASIRAREYAASQQSNNIF